MNGSSDVENVHKQFDIPTTCIELAKCTFFNGGKINDVPLSCLGFRGFVFDPIESCEGP